MKKYKLLKDIPFYDKWTVFIFDWYSAYEELNPEEHLVSHPFEDEDFKSLVWIWYEEILAKTEPKFKVWDYAVAFKKWIYLKITSIFKNGLWEYRYSNWTNWYDEDELRNPTKEELEKYFR